MKPWVLVTGATAGIGEAIAFKLASEHFPLVITGRRADRLSSIKEKLTALGSPQVEVKCFDIRNSDEVSTACKELEDSEINIEILINNAGLSQGLDPIHEGNWEDWNTMIDTNLKGLLYISSILSKKMVAKKSGHIINIGSIAGKEVYANGNVYCASKHAVDALTRAMRIDLNPYCIKVAAVSPGLVETEFSLVRFKGDATRAETVYKGYQALMAEDIAETVSFMLSRPAHVNIADVTILPTAQASARDVFKVL